MTTAGGETPLVYRSALDIFRRILRRATDEPDLYGFHGLRVEGYNVSKRANGGGEGGGGSGGERGRGGSSK